MVDMRLLATINWRGRGRCRSQIGREASRLQPTGRLEGKSMHICRHSLQEKEFIGQIEINRHESLFLINIFGSVETLSQQV